MEKITREQAEAAIELARRYLEQERRAFVPEPVEDDGLAVDDPPYVDAASVWSHKLLGSGGANRDGHYGCRLCRA